MIGIFATVAYERIVVYGVCYWLLMKNNADMIQAEKTLMEDGNVEMDKEKNANKRSKVGS
jgi:hypothetical protein